MAFDATVGGADANSFVPVEYADEYFALRLNADAWLDADSPQAALVEATRELTLLAWKGVRASAAQALAFPRAELPMPDDPDDEMYPDDVIPGRIADATCELALEFLRAGTIDIAKPDTARIVVRKKVGPLETEYARPDQQPEALRGLDRFPRVLALIAPLLEGVGMEVVRT